MPLAAQKPADDGSRMVLMQSGKLRERVTIQRKSVGRDGFGG